MIKNPQLYEYIWYFFCNLPINFQKYIYSKVYIDEITKEKAESTPLRGKYKPLQCFTIITLFKKSLYLLIYSHL